MAGSTPLLAQSTLLPYINTFYVKNQMPKQIVYGLMQSLTDYTQTSCM
jgi:hypothetical protein